MVTPTESPADANQGGIRLFAREVGGDLSRDHNFAVALRSAQLLNRQAEVFRYYGDHLLWLKDALRVRINRFA